ncbi:phage major capsid protein [Brevibacillus agri]|uniref:phage major capsid protein n=1 Tax=Brevibacillus agri TaxID=51101 RepID=UPI0025B6F920|nr:phage major capsid protein [Brevibacillus agri]MDN4093569.1 phage major capsid protein [Brevibacillus agri]
MKKIDELMQELSAKKDEVRSLLNDNKVDEAENKMSEVRSLEKKIELQKQLDKEEERKVEDKMTKTVEVRDKQNTDLEYRAISKYLLRKEMTAEERASVNVGNSGAIMPEGFINQVQVLTDGFPSLKQYTHVIPVSTNTGKIPISQGLTERKLAKLATDTALVQQMITTTPVEFAVDDYGLIIPVENSVLEDAGVNFYQQIVAPEYAEASINTENEQILSVVQANAVAGASGSDYKAIIKTLNTKIKPSLLGGTVIVTSQTGYDYLDTLTDNNGRPLLTDSLSQAGGKLFKGRPVVVLADEAITPETDGKMPFYITNLRALVKFFDRKQVEVATSTEAGFTYNQTFIRVVQRFDVVKADNRANFYIELG